MKGRARIITTGMSHPTKSISSLSREDISVCRSRPTGALLSLLVRSKQRNTPNALIQRGELGTRNEYMSRFLLSSFPSVEQMKAGRTKTRFAQTFVLLIAFHPFAFGCGKWGLTTYVTFSGHVITTFHPAKKATV